MNTNTDEGAFVRAFRAEVEGVANMFGATCTAQWKVVFEPDGRYDHYGNNKGGMVIYVTNGSTRQEVSRVGYIRRDAENPKNSYEHQLQQEVAKAKASCELLNGNLAGVGSLA